ncbi:hypothetical protein ABIS04_00990 [Shewanella sp. H8]|uniref:hypothetical protein n=1 Tax=Shewanella sp. H8 TaxID=3342676 RepID=UPI003315CA7E
MKYHLLLFLSLLTFGANAQLDVELTSHTDKEKLKQLQLERVTQQYDLAKWTFTDKVLIDESATRPYSHPTLTITVSRPSDDGSFLSQYLHEQIHWFEDSRQIEVNKVVATLKQKYPNAPITGPEGADGVFSTYLHLAVCLLEYDALTELLGKQKANEVISTNSKYFYKWIYRTVLADPEFIRNVLKQSDLYINE